MAVTFMKRGTFLLALLCANSLAPGIARSQPALCPTYCLALHCIGDLATGQIGITPGPALASVQVLEVTVRGRAVVTIHASRGPGR